MRLVFVSFFAMDAILFTQRGGAENYLPQPEGGDCAFAKYLLYTAIRRAENKCSVFKKAV